MQPTVTITAKAAQLPVTLDQAKQHLAIYHDDQDTRIDLALTSAVEYVEEMTGRALRASMSVTAAYPTWPSCVYFTRNPVTSIASVQYYPQNSGSLSTVSVSEYRLIASTELGAVLEFDDEFNPPDSDTRSDAVQINYVAGYSTEPPMAKQAVLIALELHYGDMKPQDIAANERTLKSLLRTLAWTHYR